MKSALSVSSEEKKGRGELSAFRWQHVIGTDLLRLGVLATACMCAALVFNQLREPPLSLTYVSKQSRLEQAVARVVDSEDKSTENIPPATATATSQVIGLPEFQQLVQSKRVVVLDARPEIFHRLGHVPGALSLSREAFEQDYARWRSVLEPSRDQLVAVYCSSASCEDSQMVADALVKLGYRHVLVFKGGWDEWTKADLPEEKQQ